MPATNFKALIKKEFTEQVRSSRLLISIIVFTFFAFLSSFGARYMNEIIKMSTDQLNFQVTFPDPVYTDSYFQYLKNISQTVVIAIIFLAMGTVTKEKESGSAAFVLVKPVSPFAFLLAKWMTLCFTLIASLLVSAVVCYAYTYLLFDTAGSIAAFAKMNLILILYIITFCSIFFAIGCMVNSQIASGLISFIVWIILGIISSIGTFGFFSPVRLTDEAMSLYLGFPLTWETLTGSIVLSVTLLLAGFAVFKKWEGV